MFEEVQITLVINSLNSSKSEFEQSNEIISYFKSKKIKNYIIEDINQEMNFNKETKLNKNIRTSYNKIGKIFKINNKYSIPQIIINNKLILSYKQFKNFSESYPFLFQKIITGKNCCHIRFFEDEMVYPTQSLIDNSEIICIYCYSLKKIKKQVFLSCNLRDSYNKIINDILTYCEDNQITIDLVDYENLYYYNLSMYSQEINEKINLKEDFCVVGNYISDLDNFYELIEKERINNEIKNNFKLPNIRFDNNFNYPIFKKKNPYNFIEKLKLNGINEVVFNINDISNSSIIFEEEEKN